MSNGKAVTKKSLVDEVIKLKRENVKSYGQQRQRVSSGAYIGTSGQKGGSDSNDISTAYLKTAGDTMIGPLAFYPKTQTIASGVIDVAESTGAYSSRVYIIGQSSAADNLEVILGSSHAGQILFFQPIVAAITLQSYLKTATAWSSGTSYNVGDVVLYLSQRYTCYVAHTSSGSITPADATKWHRNNIRITGSTEQVVAVDEIILLQYDSTDGVWTVVSGSGSGGAGLADANVWTNVNTFQSTVNFNGPAVNLGDSINDRVNFISQVGTDINMGTYDIVNLDRLKFGTTSGSGSALAATDTGIEAVFAGGNSYGMKSQVPANNIYQMFIGTSSKIEVGTGYITLNDNVVGGGSIQLSAMTAPSATGATQRKLYVDTADNHLKIRTNTSSIDLETSSGGGAGLGDANVWTNVNTFQNVVNFTGSAVNLGDSTNDRVNFIAQVGTDINMGTYDVIGLDRLKFSTTAGSGSALGTSDTGIEATYSGGSAYGMKLVVPTNKIYQFYSGSTEKVNIGASTILLNSPVSVTGALAMGTNKITGLGTPTATTDAATKAYVDSAGGGWTGTATSDLNMSGNDIYDSTGDVKFNDDLDMQGNDIQDVDQFDFQVTGQRFNSTSSAIQYEVPSGDSHKFIVSSNIKATLDSSSLTLASTCDLVLTYGSVIDFSAASTTSKTGGSAASLPSNPVGYILVKFSGNNRYIPYYS